MRQSTTPGFALAAAVGVAFVVVVVAVASGAASSREATTPCTPPIIEMTPVAGGQVRTVVTSPCRAKQSFAIKYDAVVRIVEFDVNGQSVVMVDGFAGVAPVNFVFEDKSRFEGPLPVQGLEQVTKVAIVWAGPVDLDLHAIEYGSPSSPEVHRWSGDPGSHQDAEQRVAGSRRSHGYISSLSTSEGLTRRVESYTLLHSETPIPGVVKLAVDVATRGDRAGDAACGGKPDAKVDFTVYILDRGRPLRRFDREIGARACGATLQAPARYVTRLIPDIVIGHRD